MSELKILVEYSVKENKLNDFLTEIKNNKIREKVLEEKGCISYDYFLPEDITQNKLVLIEKWQSKDLQQLHLTTPHMQTFSAIKEKYVYDTNVTFWNK